MLEGLSLPTRRFPCAVRTLVETLEPKDAAIFKDAVENDEWKSKTLSNALRDRGIVIGDDSISRHRKGQCSCSKA
jgi:hypothetical protein